MIANRVKRWRCAALGLSVSMLLSVCPTLQADEPDSALGTPGVPLETIDGRVFHDVTIVGIDPNGILFKHARGAGKVRFVELSPEIQAHFGFDPVAAAAFEKRGKPGKGQPAAAKALAGGGAATSSPITVSFRSRVILPSRSSVSPCAWGPGEAWSATGCGPTLANFFWPYQWGRWHPGLAYARFPCRQAAERDFLISTGILPRPYGIRTWRYWR